jgi:tyrosine-specific transport protein
MIAAYVALVIAGAPHVKGEYLKHADWSLAAFAVPAMIISFGYHNLIPSMTTYLRHDVKKLRMSILIGSATPLIFYLAWEWVILGIIPPGGFHEALSEGAMVTRALRSAAGVLWVVDAANYFAFFAIATSFITVALGLVDFLADGLHIRKDRAGKFFLTLLAIAPPFAFSLVYPGAFLTALRYAGAFGAVVLFGILPALMVWTCRYQKKSSKMALLPGGKWGLALIIFLSSLVIVLEFV